MINIDELANELRALYVKKKNVMPCPQSLYWPDEVLEGDVDGGWWLIVDALDDALGNPVDGHNFTPASHPDNAQGVAEALVAMYLNLDREEASDRHISE